MRILHFNSKCAFWIKIWKTVFWTVCTPNHIAMHNLKCAFQMTVQRCFPVTISQITQPNHCMNALTSKSWFGGWSYIVSDLLTTSAYRVLHTCMYRSTGNASPMHGRVPRHSSPAGMQNPKFGLSCVHCVIQTSQSLLSCVHCVIENAHFELKFKIRTLPSCENSLRLRSCLFCEGRISVLKRWFKTPIQNAVNSGYCSSSSEPERRLYDVI